MYLRKVPGNCHGCVHGELNIMAFVWMINNGIRRPNNHQPLDIGNAVKGAYGNTKAEPDVVIMDSASRNPIAIIEVEVTHRSGNESREDRQRCTSRMIL